MSARKPRLQPQSPVAAGGRRTFANSPNRRREVMRAAAWLAVAAWPAVLIPYLMH